ncbi:MAG: PDZ domain-containing protein, partial [Rhodobacteraceae bacterium]|nr:PDZ domain-containing protein [Paracoccaceae bacterium]
MKKVLMAALMGTVAGAFFTAQIAGPLIAQEAGKDDGVYQQLALFGDIFQRIRAQYVEPVDSKKLIEAAINGMLTSLDPHSSYMAADDYKDMQVQTKGEFGGLGIEVTQENGFIKVISPMDGTPAAKAGLQAGDFITKVDGKPVTDLTLDKAVDTMRGPVGSEIVVTIVRQGVKDPFDVSMIRDTIKLVAVKSRTVGKTVVLRISSFSDQTFSGLQTELKKSVDAAGGMKNVEGFVIDLRNNP